MKMCKDENYLLLKVNIINSKVVIVSIYSDFYHKNPTFLAKLQQDILSLNCKTILIAGDFNVVTYHNKISANNVHNIDSVNVRQIPNPQNSVVLRKRIEI